MASRKAVDLNEKETEEFIDLFHGQKNLWDTSSKLYHDRMKRTESFKFIIDALGNPELTEADLKGKIQRLRSSLTREIRKERNSLKSGSSCDDVYRSKWRFFKLLQFLRHISCKEGYSNMVEPGSQDKDHEEDFNEESPGTQGSQDLYQLFQQVQQHQVQVHRDGEDFDSVSNIETPRSIPSTPTTPSTKTVKRHLAPAPDFEKKKKKVSTEDIALGILSTLVSKQPPSQEKSENECFADYIVSQLVKMPVRLQRATRSRIFTVLEEMMEKCEPSDD